MMFLSSDLDLKAFSLGSRSGADSTALAWTVFLMLDAQVSRSQRIQVMCVAQILAPNISARRPSLCISVPEPRHCWHAE